MPELPEVEVVRRGLSAHVLGRTITQVSVRHDRAVRRHPGGAADFAAALAGRRVTAVRRRGKYLWLALDDTDAVLAHLGMSGQFRVGGEDHSHLRIRLSFADGGPDIDFRDQRTFGGMQFVPGGADLPAPIAHIARDLLDPDLDLAGVVERIRGKNSEIKRVLLDQTVVSGIGNIYADESLWAAKLHYARTASALSRPAIRRVLAAAADVMAQALEAGGTTFDSMYVNVNGESGYFERSLHAYGQQDRPCERCGTAIRREPFMNRSSFFCPRCQRRA